MSIIIIMTKEFGNTELSVEKGVDLGFGNKGCMFPNMVL